jgi:hypothetical protein
MFNVFDSVRPHRRQSVVSAAGSRTSNSRRKACASMAGRDCQRSERLRSQSRWLFDDTGRRAEEVSGSKAGDPYELVWKRFFPESNED